MSALLSAHAGGCGRNRHLREQLESYIEAVKHPVDYVEFDVQRSGDGQLFLYHDNYINKDGKKFPVSDLEFTEIERILGPRAKYEDVLDILANAGKKAHIDYKFVSENGQNEVAAYLKAHEYFENDSFIITTHYDSSLKAIHEYTRELPYSPTLGLSLPHFAKPDERLLDKTKRRVTELNPKARLEECGANLMVLHHRLASLRLLTWAHRHNYPVLLWTVDHPTLLNRFLGDERVWMVTTNFPLHRA